MTADKVEDSSNVVLQKTGTRHMGAQTNSGAMEMAQQLKDVLPVLAKLSQRGLHSRSDHTKIVFDQKDLIESGITRKKRKYQKYNLFTMPREYAYVLTTW